MELEHMATTITEEQASIHLTAVVHTPIMAEIIGTMVDMETKGFITTVIMATIGEIATELALITMVGITTYGIKVDVTQEPIIILVQTTGEQ